MSEAEAERLLQELVGAYIQWREFDQRPDSWQYAEEAKKKYQHAYQAVLAALKGIER